MEAFIFLWVMLAFALGFLGADRKIGYWSAFWLSLLLSPVVSLFICLISARKEPPIIIREITRRPVMDVADQIAKYKKLLDEGAITQVEFDTQKSKILG